MYKWDHTPCPDCKAVGAVRTFADHLCCTNCGLVVEDTIFDETAEHRTFMDMNPMEAAERVRADTVLMDSKDLKINSSAMRDSWESLLTAMQSAFPHKELGGLFEAAKTLLSHHLKEGQGDSKKIELPRGALDRACFMAAAIYHVSKNQPGMLGFRVEELTDIVGLSLPPIYFKSVPGRMSKAILGMTSTALKVYPPPVPAPAPAPTNGAASTNKTQKLSAVEAQIRRFVNASPLYPPEKKRQIITLSERLAARARAASDKVYTLANSQPPKLAASIIVIVVTSVLSIPKLTVEMIAKDTHTSKTTINKIKKAILSLATARC